MLIIFPGCAINLVPCAHSSHEKCRGCAFQGVILLAIFVSDIPSLVRIMFDPELGGINEIFFRDSVQQSCGSPASSTAAQWSLSCSSERCAAALLDEVFSSERALPMRLVNDELQLRRYQYLVYAGDYPVNLTWRVVT